MLERERERESQRASSVQDIDAKKHMIGKDCQKKKCQEKKEVSFSPI